MRFNKHFELEGRHAFLSASKPHWLRYSDEKLDRVFGLNEAARRGTELHDLASRAIKLGVKFAGNGKTVNKYVNDCIGFRMSPEQPLYYSENCFGTADAVSFRNKKLRIFDLKTGTTPAHVEQLEVYAALFCLEYRMNPFEIEIELRLYQNDEVDEYIADPDVIFHIMDKIKSFDKRINALREEALS